ncbi:MAG: hypothetical protein ACYDCN_09290 [Bacteroidia bacterium]
MKKKKHINAIFYYSSNDSQFLSDADAFFVVLGTPLVTADVTIPARDLIAARAAVVTARAAVGTSTSRTRGTADAKNLSIEPVVTYVQNFSALVAIAANNAPTVRKANNIVTECLLHTRKPSTKHKDGFTFSNDATIAQQFDFAFKAVPNKVHASYEGSISLDGIKWESVKASPDSRFTFTHAFAVGTKVWGRGRITLSEKKGGQQAWITPPEPFVFTK